MSVNWDSIKGRWNEMKGDAEVALGDITDDDWKKIDGNKDRLVAKLQQAKGWTKEQAEENVDNHFKKYDEFDDRDNTIF